MTYAYARQPASVTTIEEAQERLSAALDLLEKRAAAMRERASQASELYANLELISDEHLALKQSMDLMIAEHESMKAKLAASEKARAQKRDTGAQALSQMELLIANLERKSA